MVRRPRVLVIPSSYFAGRRTVGGGERYAREYADALSRLTPATLGLFDSEPLERMEGTLRIRHFRVRDEDDRLIFPITAEAIAETAEYDIVHLMVFPTPATDLLTLLGKIRGQRIVLTDVGGGLPSPGTYLGRIHPKLAPARLAHGLALLSEHSARQYEGWRQPRVILYGGAGTQSAPEQGPGSADEPYALFVGRLLPHKKRSKPFYNPPSSFRRPR